MTGGLPSTSGPRHSVIAILAIVYGTFLVFVVFWPSPIDQPVASLLERVIAELHERGVPQFVGYRFIEFSANVLLFIPVGILFGLIVPLRWWPVAFLLGPLLSAGIEVAQRFLLDARYASLSDVVANSIGASIGVLLAVSLRGMVHARDARVIDRYEAMRRLPAS